MKKIYHAGNKKYLFLILSPSLHIIRVKKKSNLTITIKKCFQRCSLLITFLFQ